MQAIPVRMRSFQGAREVIRPRNTARATLCIPYRLERRSDLSRRFCVEHRFVLESLHDRERLIEYTVDHRQDAGGLVE
jgi:hypothetical protein